MIWHHSKRKDDGFLRHPADSLQWKKFDEVHPKFASEPRNVRLGLATDGFNPFSQQSLSHSTWPVIVIPYNLPPWMCMKQPNFMLSLLISGPSAPGNDIDVYLQPLIDELKILWADGVTAFDVRTQKSFKMFASLLWTIHDYPGYGDISGWSTKGKLACAVCKNDTESIRLEHGKKESFMGHRRFLDMKHYYRSDKKSFNNQIETRVAPKRLTGSEIYSQVYPFRDSVTFGKTSNVPKDCRPSTKRNKKIPLLKGWKKMSIFFELPYWKTLLLRHNIDVMHTEKNVCDNILNTILEMDGKTKDNLNARFDLQSMGIRKELHPIRRGEEWDIPSACFNLTTNEKILFLSVFKSLRLPDGYCSNIFRNVKMKERKFIGLKSHDCHVIMQQLLPIALRKSTKPVVTSVLVELCGYFHDICSKVIEIKLMERWEKRIIYTLCNLEKIFPPGFFTVMVHLTVHLATEVKIAGPVQYRWMYPIERYIYLIIQL